MTEKRSFQAVGFSVLVLLIGIALRLVFGQDIEFKGDEQFIFESVMGSRAHSGFSSWILLSLGKLFHVQNPVDLARTIQWTNCLALGLMLVFVWRTFQGREREVWLWAFAF